MSERASIESTAGIEDSGSIAPGGQLTSFDELEAIDNSKAAEARSKAIEEAVIESEKKKLENNSEKTEEVEDDSQEEPKAAKKADQVDDTEEVSEQEQEIKEASAKMFKALIGEDETELNGDAKIKVKVDGEEVEMSLEDIINGTSGQEAIKKRFGELGSQKKNLLSEKAKWSQEKAFFDMKLQNALELLNKDPLAGFASFVDMAGMDSAKWLEAFVPKMTEQFQSLADMSEEELKLHEQNVLTQQKEARILAKEADLNTQAQQQQVLRQVKELQAKFDIDDDVFREKFLELEELQRAGKITGEITPDFVTDVVRFDRTEAKISAVAEVVRPSLIKDKKSLGDLTEVLLNQDPNGEFTEDDIKDIIRQAFPENAGTEETLSKKVMKSKKSMESKKNKPAVEPQSEPVSFDDI